MTRMNWDRVKRENMIRRNYDRSAMLDRAGAPTLDQMPRRDRHARRGVRAGNGAPRRSAASGSAPAAQPAPPQARRSVTKEQRDRQAARRLGVTVDQLLALRRVKAAEDQALHREAKRLGTTVKELGRLRRSVGSR